MTDQLDIGLWSTQYHRESARSIDEAFRQFHRDNPHVYAELVRLTRRWANRNPGRKCGIGMLWEVMRWRSGMRTVGEDVQLNNNYRSRYVRMLVREHPEYASLFEMRELRAR